MPTLGPFNDILNAAVQIKTALVKARPGRQEWEQAPPFFRCTAAPSDSVLRARQEGFSIQHSTALQLKEQGNELISKGPEAALERYAQAIAVFLWLDRGHDRASEDVPLVCSADKLQGEEQEQAYQLLAVSFCNAAACLLKLGLTADAEYACSKALRYDPYSVKALYRRALAHRAAASTAGLEAAGEDLAAANRLEPGNQQVRVALAAVQQELREQRRKEQGLYGNMFERGQLYGDGSGVSDGGRGSGSTTIAPVAPGAAGSHREAGLGAGAGRGWQAGARTGAAAGSHEGEDEEDDVSGRDPEDLLYKDLEDRKAHSARASREADVVMRSMKRSLARARNRKLAERLGVERSAAGRGRLSWWAVPWWAYALIGLHLAYRLIKLWRLPLPSGRAEDAAGQADVPLGHTEL